MEVPLYDRGSFELMLGGGCVCVGVLCLLELPFARGFLLPPSMAVRFVAVPIVPDLSCCCGRRARWRVHILRRGWEMETLGVVRVVLVQSCWVG